MSLSFPICELLLGTVSSIKWEFILILSFDKSYSSFGIFGTYHVSGAMLRNVIKELGTT